MVVRIVRLGSARSDDEGLRIGAVRRPAQWAAFARRYRTEMATPDNAHTIELLAAMSAQTNFAVGCYCENDAHCHRSLLRALLAEQGAKLG